MCRCAGWWGWPPSSAAADRLLDPLVSTLALILLALLGARLSFSTRRVPSGYRLILRTGTHFLFIGFLLGPSALAFLTESAVDQLSPLVGLALGWIGLLFGLQLDRTTLGQFPRSFLIMAFGQAAVTFGVCVAVGFLAAGYLGFSGPTVSLLILGASATACISTPASVAMVSGNFMARGRVRELLFFVAALDGVVGIVALHLTYVGLHGTPLFAGQGAEPVWFWAVAGIALGVVCAIIFLWLLRLRPKREELVLYLLGLSALASGAAMQLQLSPLFVGATAGILITNFNPQWQRVFQLMHNWEKAIYVILLLLAGAALRFPTWWVVPMALAYAAVRVVGKVVGNALLVRTAGITFDTPRRLGLGLIPQGGISIAMALSLSVVLGATSPVLGGLDAGQILFGTVVLGVVFSELVGPLFTTQILRAAGEITPEVEEAIAEGDEWKAREKALTAARKAGDGTASSIAYEEPSEPPSDGD